MEFKISKKGDYSRFYDDIHDDIDWFLMLDVEECSVLDKSDVEPLSLKLRECVCEYLENKKEKYTYKTHKDNITVYDNGCKLCNIYWNNPAYYKDSDLESEKEAVLVAKKICDLLNEDGDLKYPVIRHSSCRYEIWHKTKKIASFCSESDCDKAFDILVTDKYGQSIGGLIGVQLMSAKASHRSIVTFNYTPFEVDVKGLLFVIREYIQDIINSREKEC